MKKVLLIILGIIVVAIAGYAIYGFGCRKSIPVGATADEQVLAILEQNDCFVCHAAEPDLPFYAKFPGMKGAMAEHVLHAQRFVDLKAATADLSTIDEVTLAKIEHAVLEETMPIAQYKAVHWGTGFNDEEEGILAAWIMNVRAQRFATGMNCGKYANEPIQALPDGIEVDSAKVDLGRRLYDDKRISLDSTVSCATCHILDKGGVSDPSHRTSEGINGQFGGVNAPTVYNAYFNIQQFWNGRAADLAAQAAGPPANPVEMGDQTWEQICARLSQDAALVAEFEQLYPGQGLTEATVTNAIAEFEKTLITPNGAFDRYLKGDENAISEMAEDGYEEFLEHGCAACHVGVIAGGQSFEYLGIFEDYFATRDASIQYNADDDGLKGFTGNDADLHKFKVPTLRNVVLTAPYFHDGSIATLEEAIRAMCRYELGKPITEEEVREITEFLKTL